ncbi:MAG: hypothetical protein ACQUHE_18360, partial [Bacteroidia bacterium]
GILEIIAQVPVGHDKGKSTSPKDIICRFILKIVMHTCLKFLFLDKHIFKTPNQSTRIHAIGNVGDNYYCLLGVYFKILREPINFIRK